MPPGRIGRHPDVRRGGSAAAEVADEGLVDGPPPGGRAAEAWFFETTEAGKTLLAARKALEAQEAPFPFWFYMAPGHR